MFNLQRPAILAALLSLSSTPISAQEFDGNPCRGLQDQGGCCTLNDPNDWCSSQSGSVCIEDNTCNPPSSLDGLNFGCCIANTDGNSGLPPTNITVSPSSSPTTSTPTTLTPTLSPSITSQPTDGIFIQPYSAQTLVDNLVKGDVQTFNVQSSPHINECGALLANGQLFGNLYARGPAPNYELLVDAEGNYIPTNIPIAPTEGIILSSGYPSTIWKQDSDKETADFGRDGDVDLDATVAADPLQGGAAAYDTYDACILEFDFKCGDSSEGISYVPRVSFKYVFGSEEYYEYVESKFNDVFAFYLNGENIAKLPSTSTSSDIVSINNVNYDENKQYFNGNDPGNENKVNPDDAPTYGVVYHKMEADGFTNTLTAYGTPYTDANEMNHIKLAVADVGDRILDSWVILESASFTCVDITEAPSVSLSPSIGTFLAPL